MLDRRAIRAHLTLMNMQAPFEQQWVATLDSVGPVAKEQGIHARVQFWLVDETSECVADSTVIKGDRI